MFTRAARFLLPALAFLSCTRGSNAPSPIAARADASLDGSSPTSSAPSASAPAAILAAKESQAAPALVAPASHPVTPHVESVLTPEGFWGAKVTDLPAISQDGSVVAIAADDDSPRTCAHEKLLFLTTKTPTKKPEIFPLTSCEDGGSPDDPRSPASRARLTLVEKANAALRRYKLRTFDGGAITTPEVEWRDERSGTGRLSLPAVRIDVTLAGDASLLLRMRGIAASGPLFDIDLTPWQVRGYDIPKANLRMEGSLTNFATLAVDVQKRVVVFQGSYMSANTWLSAAETTFVLAF